MTTRPDLAAAAFIAWTDYGSDGWSPHPFASEADLIAWIQDGSTYGSGFVVTSGGLALAITPPALVAATPPAPENPRHGR